MSDHSNIATISRSLKQSGILSDGNCKADMVASRRTMLRYYTSSFAFMLTTNVENNCSLSGNSFAVLDARRLCLTSNSVDADGI